MINTISKYNFLITIIFLNSSMLMAQKYETQEYQVIDQIDNAEIRFYPSAAMIKVSADQNRNNNFGNSLDILLVTIKKTKRLLW